MMYDCTVKFIVVLKLESQLLFKFLLFRVPIADLRQRKSPQADLAALRGPEFVTLVTLKQYP